MSAADGLPDLARLELGTAHPPIELDSSDAVREACLALVAKARREVVILSRQLDPVLFDHPSAAEALRAFVLRSRRTRLRVLVQDPEPAIRTGHRLVDLVQRLTSFAEIRVPSAEHHAYNAAFLVADQQGVVYRSLADRFEATVSLADRHLAGECQRRFEEMWETSRAEPALRRIHL